MGEKIRGQGWEFMCGLREPTYPKLVKEFYCNIEFGIGARSVVFLVKGVEIKLDKDDLGRILHMPTNGSARERLDISWIGLESILRRGDISMTEWIKTPELSVEMSLLHRIVSSILFPSGRHHRFNSVSKQDICIILCIIKSIPLNLPAFMLRRMHEASRRSEASLPCGMVRTLIFREFQVDLDGETTQQSSHYTDNERSLHSMGNSKIDGQWVSRRGSGTEEGGDDKNRAKTEAPSSQEPAGHIQEPAAPEEAPSSQRGAGCIREPSETAAPDHPHVEEQHFEAFGTDIGISFESGPRTHQPESSGGPTMVRLDEGQLCMIVEQVVSGLTAARAPVQGESSVREEFRQSTTVPAPPPVQCQAQQTDTMLVPHVATLARMVTELRLELSDIRTLVTCLHGRSGRC